MGRPNDCGCCGGLVAPSSVCSNKGYYNQEAWVEQTKTTNVSGQYIPYNSVSIPSGDRIILKWEEASARNWTGGIACSPDEHGSGWYPHTPNDTYWFLPEYKCSGIHYEYVATKDFFVPSGAKVYGKIEALTTFINAKITINDGEERTITSFYDSLNYDSLPDTCCPGDFCDKNSYITKNSGCYRITVSGSTINKNLLNERVWIAGSGAILFDVSVSGNDSYINANWTCPVNATERRNQRCNCGTCCVACDRTNIGLGAFCIGTTSYIACSGQATGGPSGFSWDSDGTCEECETIYACCLPNGTCIETNCYDCESLGGTPNVGSCFGPYRVICLVEDI